MKTRLLRRLRKLGYRSHRHVDPASRATVIDLAMHCTDAELASFLHLTPDKVRSHRRAMNLSKYISDIYIRPAA